MLLSNSLLCITSSYIIIDGVIVDLSQFIHVEVQLYLFENTLHHGHENTLIPLVVVIRGWGVTPVCL